MGPGDHLLLGTDLVKAESRLVAAYDDAQGVTAAFNRNLLDVLNRELNANFDVGSFCHHAVWNAEESRIEMRLRSQRAQDVDLRRLAMTVHFEPGEEVLTEISSKFSSGRLPAELAEAGLDVARTWSDRDGDFLVTLARPGR
jgi:L-histidine N-alpha-methyltransferase